MSKRLTTIYRQNTTFKKGDRVDYMGAYGWKLTGIVKAVDGVNIHIENKKLPLHKAEIIIKRKPEPQPKY